MLNGRWSLIKRGTKLQRMIVLSFVLYRNSLMQEELVSLRNQLKYTKKKFKVCTWSCNMCCQSACHRKSKQVNPPSRPNLTEHNNCCNQRLIVLGLRCVSVGFNNSDHMSKPNHDSYKQLLKVSTELRTESLLRREADNGIASLKRGIYQY